MSSSASTLSPAQRPRVAVISALQAELSAVLEHLQGARRETRAGREFVIGRLHGVDVVAALSRIGKVSAATTATVLIEHFGATRMVFTGLAGGLHPDARVGDVVVGTAYLQHDLDASPLFPRHEVPLYGVSRFAADPALAQALVEAARASLADLPELIGAEARAQFRLERPAVHQGLIVSGDRFVATSRECAALRAELPEALAVEMEGAAVAQVCHDYGLPFAAVRTISDRADDQAHVDFPLFLNSVASRYSAAIVDALLKAA
ncbi:MAG TPA: 5'-methylthioadenosine/adenosylhomocysteine nucleosidase [Burkholderiaceae bacterium]|jgi:adenosylhomocysteine nucleosidase|nr:5'-methylthioadenosine/adenosylhomocysteine nucleosidase [Burkholderiaceae bacterium]